VQISCEIVTGHRLTDGASRWSDDTL
jgi:hypothetical protein